MECIYIIFGTRPEYLKLISIINEFKIHGYNYKIIYIAQHKNLINNIIDNNINENIIKIDIETNDFDTDFRLMNIGRTILSKLPQYIVNAPYIIVQGDTATAFYSALVAYQLGVKIIHIEAGLRTYDIDAPFPEEGYRQMISRIATFHFTPHDDSISILENEKVFGNIFNVGNTILDLVKSYNLQCTTSNIVIITFHRRENLNKIHDLLTGINKLTSITPELTYLWYIHPSIKISILNTNNNIQFRQPIGHKEFMTELAKCKFIITDSGGIQEEAAFIGKHCIVTRKSTERTHIPKEYITIIEDYTQLDKVYNKIPKNELKSCNVYGNGDSAKKIINCLINYFYLNK